jgi:hypothetical protein
MRVALATFGLVPGFPVPLQSGELNTLTVAPAKKPFPLAWIESPFTPITGGAMVAACGGREAV